MQKVKFKWRADPSARAVKAFREIQASIRALQDEDLLDLHDIFVGRMGGPLDKLASAEVSRRNLTV